MNIVTQLTLRNYNLDKLDYPQKPVQLCRQVHRDILIVSLSHNKQEQAARFINETKTFTKTQLQ